MKPTAYSATTPGINTQIGHYLLAGLFIFVFLMASSKVAWSEDHVNIMVVHSYSQEYPWTKNQHEGFIDALYAHSTDEFIIKTEYLDTKRKYYDDAYAEKYQEYLKYKYDNYRPDIIYTTDDNAFTFARSSLTKLFPGVPIFFSGVNDYSVINELDTFPVTGVFEKKEIAPNLALMRKIHQDIKNIIIVGDASNTYKAIKREAMAELKQQPSINATFIAHDNIDQLIDTLGQRDEQFIFLTTLGSVSDQNGHTLSLNDTISRIVQSGHFVVFSMEDAYMLEGVMGGYVTSGKKQGHTAARMVLTYLSGTKTNQIPVVTQSPNEYIFDQRELLKNDLHLPERILATATILHKKPTFYERNRTFILGTIVALAILLFISMVVFIYLFSNKNRKIQSTSNEIIKQSKIIEQVKDRLTEAQRIAHLGSWEWDIVTNELEWSDEVFRIFGEQPGSFKPSYEKFMSYIPSQEHQKVEDAIASAIQTKRQYDVEHSVVLQDRSVRYVRELGLVKFNDQNKPIFMVGTVLDITTLKIHERREKERHDVIERYQNALMEWSRVNYKNIDEAFSRAAEISAQTLDIERVSIWLYKPDKSAIQCQDLYNLSTGAHEKGLELFKKDFPNYFRALEAGNMMAVNDAQNDERTNEFTQSYLQPLNIYSMLDAPIFYQGEILGVVCHENIGAKREWTIQEQEFTSAISKTVSLSLEVEKRKEAERQLVHQAYHDGLTNLPNRNLFLDRLEQEIKQARRSQKLLAVIFLDLDNFKKINDSLGHAAGDQVLVNMAEKLKNNLREVDTIARLGGDEFTLLLGSFKNTQDINSTIDKIFNRMQISINLDNKELFITSSMGISIYPNDGKSANTLLRNADAAMYKAKDEGRNGYQFYTQDMTERAIERVSMEANLRRALEKEEFVVYYQPQFNTNPKKLIGMEALVRWVHPEMGLVSPAKFIPLAEETGLIVELDRWVMRTALTQISTWLKQGLNPGRLSLNLAMKQLQQNDFIDMIEATLRDTDCKPESLTLEVTESQIMIDPEKAINILWKISDMGIEIAVDDFGTGYSSLTYLKRFPVDKLKIDQSFIRDIPDDEDDAAIVQAIIALSKSLKMSVIAEGVETETQKDFLLQDGCSQIQGYLYGRPMPANDMQELLEKPVI